MRSQNPVLNERAFASGGAALAEPPQVPGFPSDRQAPAHLVTDRMTVEGTIYRTALLLVIVLVAAALSWRAAERGALLLPGVGVAFFALLGLALATAFRPRWAIVTGPLYAVVSGVLIGAVSAIYNAEFDGIVGQATIGTIATAAGMLLAYRTGVIRATPTFRKVVVSATLGIVLLYVVSIGLRLFGLSMPLLHDTGPMGIAVSLFIVAVAALNLVLDFDFIERASASGAEQRMEWFGAFGLTVTLVWLYLELLRLLAKLRD